MADFHSIRVRQQSPHWSKTGATDKPLFNARSETVLEKPTFKSAFVRGRCLIPASGWYEWLRTDLGGKQPYHLRLREDGPFAFAGLFDVWRGEGEKPVVSCTILTTAASDGISWLHERMPVVLDYDHYDMWLDRTTPDIADLTELLRPYPAQELEVYPVRTVVNRANAEGRRYSRRWASLPEGRCELCGRTQPLTFHHLIPRRNHRRGWFRRTFSKEEMNRRGLMLCRLCHRQLHHTYDALDLGRRLNTREAILSEPEMQRFLEWARRQR